MSTDPTSRDYYADLMQKATEEYTQKAKGTKNIGPLSRMIKRLFCVIFQRLKQNNKLEIDENEYIDQQILDITKKKEENEEKTTRLLKDKEIKEQEIKLALIQNEKFQRNLESVRRENIELEEEIREKKNIIEMQKTEIVNQKLELEKSIKRKKGICC